MRHTRSLRLLPPERQIAANSRGVVDGPSLPLPSPGDCTPREHVRIFAGGMNFNYAKAFATVGCPAQLPCPFKGVSCRLEIVGTLFDISVQGFGALMRPCACPEQVFHDQLNQKPVANELLGMDPVYIRYSKPSFWSWVGIPTMGEFSAHGQAKQSFSRNPRKSAKTNPCGSNKIFSALRRGVLV